MLRIKNIFLKIIQIKLHAAILLSLLLVSLVVAVSLISIKNFLIYQEKVDPEVNLNIKTFHYYVKNYLKKEYIKYTSPKELKDDESSLKTFSVTISQKDINLLNSNLPDSGKKQYVYGYLKVSDDKEVKKVKLRYRGDNNYHWLYDQKSLRIKMLSKDTYNMDKKFNLINPPGMISFRDVVNYDISKKLGLISPDCYPVRVKINGKYMGVYLYISQVDESLLRKEKLMPGSIYYGDLLGYEGDDNLWTNHKLWDKKASRNAEQKQNKEDIEFYINSIKNDNDIEFYKFAEQYLEKDKYFKFIALDRLLGTHHHDYTHNHKVYFDPYKGKFEPISWDIRFWLDLKEKDLSLYTLQLKIANNPIYDAQIDKIVFDLINSGIYDEIATKYQNTIDLLLPDLERDIYRDRATIVPYISQKAISEPFTKAQLQMLVRDDKEILKRRFNFLLETFNDLKFTYDLIEISHDKYKLVVDIDGNSPAKVDFSNLKKMDVKKLVDNQEVSSNSFEILYPGRKIAKGTQKLFPVRAWGDYTVKNSKNRYEFLLYNKDNQNIAQEIIDQIKLTNYITQAKIMPKKMDSKLFTSVEKNSLSKYNSPSPKQTTLKGVIEVSETLVFDKSTTIKIEPGTIFRMHPKKSIYFYGKVLAMGTKEKPIRFVAKDSKKPWGIVTVQGKKTAGSKFNFCYFENGSVDTRNLINYTAPFNIHNMDNFEVKNCTIGQNHIGDDSMHIAYAKGVVENSIFINARSDGLDVDIADVKIKNNIFYKSGNDGLDIMTTKMFASNNIFINTGDKGISAGEWSDVKLENSYFINNEIGLEVKDKTKLIAKNLVFENAIKKAINLYNKNKRYGSGGHLTGEAIYLIGNKKVKKDKTSSLDLKTKKSFLLSDEKWFQDLKQRAIKYEY